MLEHNAALIRRPLLTGHQHIEGLWFAAERFSEAERVRQLLEHWQTEARAYRFADGDLLRFRQPIAVQCEALTGWPLIRQGNTLCSALLDPQEMRSLPAADIWLVRGSHVSAQYLRDAEALAPGDWLDINGLTLLDTYDCRNVLPEPVLEPVAVVTDVREILGDALRPVSPEQEQVMQALLDRQQKAAKGPVYQAVTAKETGWTQSADTPLPWLKLSVTLVILIAIFWMGSQGQNPGLQGLPAKTATPVSVQISGIVVGTLIGGIALTLILAGLRHVLRRPVPVQPAAPRAAEPGIEPRATPAKAKPSRWRRWVTRLTENSRLSALYGKRQAAYMRRMLEMFEDGDFAEALRHAIPLGSEQSSGEQSFGTPQRRQDLMIDHSRGPTRSIRFEHDMEAHLRQVYRQTFERLDRAGRIEEAVFVLAELLKVRQESLDYLEKHGRLQQAADLALAWDMPSAMIVRLLCLADNWQRALLVARRDNAFAAAVTLLQGKWPESADRLRLEWAESLTRKGLWLQAVEVIWPLSAERKRAAQWLLDAEAAGGALALGALVKRAALLPDTLQAYAEWVEQLRDDPARHAERAALAEILLQHKTHVNALAWLAGAIVHAVLADQIDGHGRLSHQQLQALVSMSKDKLLQADLPGALPTLAASVPLSKVSEPLEWTAPLMGNRKILDAVPLEEGRYLLALGEAGAVVIDAHGQTLCHFSVPAHNIVLAHDRQVVLVLARRDDVWRISKLDLVTRSGTDLGVQMFDVFARSFDGLTWTLGRGRQVRVVDVDHGFETLWHVSDLPAHVGGLNDDAHNEYLWLNAGEKGTYLWHYRLPERRLMSRDLLPHMPADNFRLLDADGRVIEAHLNVAGNVLELAWPDGRKNYRLPGLDLYEIDLMDAYLQGQWLVIRYLTVDQDMRWHFIHLPGDRLCATLQWPVQGVKMRCVGADYLLFDLHGRLSHINVDTATQHNISLN
ncbi:bpX6 domain-containing protein [Pseudomonas sp. NPDC087817]|uniref:bpX6 domain-containing protein n=1 Tax=Pseudomonas sp. NPDC087817 TaxID=3364451 RepID=UPI00381A1FCD